MYKVVGAVGTVENCDRALGRGRSFPSTVGTGEESPVKMESLAVWLIFPWFPQCGSFHSPFLIHCLCRSSL